MKRTPARTHLIAGPGVACGASYLKATKDVEEVDCSNCKKHLKPKPKVEKVKEVDLRTIGARLRSRGFKT